MSDNEFDDLVRESIAYDPGYSNEEVWTRAKPSRWEWLPSIRETLICGTCFALILAAFGMLNMGRNPVSAAPNAVVENAMHSRTGSIVASITHIDFPAKWER